MSNINFIHRDKCSICQGELEDIYTIPDFPIYMGVNHSDRSETCDLIYCTCKLCRTLQIRNLIPLDILYENNHNTDIVGNLWKNHYKQFSSFIFDDIDIPNTILEIGDPACKLAQSNKGRSFNKWIIVEPTDLCNSFDRVHHIKDVLNSSFDIKKYTLDPVDVVIFSHSFEHMYNPFEVVQKITEVIKDGGHLFISLPDMDYIAEYGLVPFNCLTFEHTVFLNPDIIEYLFQNNFSFDGIEYYKNHSIFFKLKKQSNNKNNISNTEIAKINSSYNILFEDTIRNIFGYINTVNEKIESIDSYYVYGAHISTQFLLKLGINPTKILGILDNSEMKIGKVLYGTPYKVFSPSILKDGTFYVLCNVGAFTPEIKSDLLKINKNIVFI